MHYVLVVGKRRAWTNLPLASVTEGNPGLLAGQYSHQVLSGTMSFTDVNSDGGI